MGDLFTEDELIDFTGYRSRHHQIKWLKDNGFLNHRVNRAGRVLLSKSYAATVLGGTVLDNGAIESPAEPDFDAI